MDDHIKNNNNDISGLWNCIPWVPQKSNLINICLNYIQYNQPFVEQAANIQSKF